MSPTKKSPTPDGAGSENINSQFKLISVSFKEAALDSPTFRATVNHSDIQVDNVEEWISALISSIKKIPACIEELEAHSNAFFENLAPTFLQDGLMDQEYTVQALRTTLEASKIVWKRNLSQLSIYSFMMIENLYSTVSKKISNYRSIRQKFETKQEKYDRYLKTYLATPKTKQPEMIQEDAEQLYLVRKDYLNESLNLITELSELGSILDEKLIDICTDVWKNKKDAIKDLDDPDRQNWDKMQRIKSWNELYMGAIKKLKSDMLLARDQVGESLSENLAPSKNINDYKFSTINSKTLAMTDECNYEKHGYLFMKTIGNKSSKPIWVKRWVFIKNGTFGLLVLSPSRTFVQESDKIGILLSKVRYTPNEDRRFCFEVRMVDQVIVFQAETLAELKSWLKVFENERSRLFKESLTDPGLLNISSGRYPPMVTELASTIKTGTDIELTNNTITDNSGQIITSTKLSTFIEGNEKNFQRYVYYEIPQIRPPFMTDTTKSAIIAYSLIAPTSIPTALTANIWGSVNWGLYYLNEKFDEKYEQVRSFEEESDYYEVYTKDGIKYPDFYPYVLVPLDIQLRALFEAAVEPNDFCLFSFRCIWSPNSRQELNGRCFLTNNYLYFYMQAFGFIALNKIPINQFVSVEYSSQPRFDSLKIFSVNGVIKLKLFLDDGKIIKRKFTFLINNRISIKPKGLESIIKELLKIENKKDELINSNATKVGGLVPKSTVSFIPSKNGNRAEAYKIDFSDEGQLIFSNRYSLPPKAIFHALLGEDSEILRKSALHDHFQGVIKKAWYLAPDGKSYRTLIVNVRYQRKTRGITQLSQVIEDCYDNEYYVFTNTVARLKFTLGSPFRLHERYVIIKAAGGESKVYVFLQISFEWNSIFNSLVRKFCCSILNNKGYSLDYGLSEAVRQVGKHGMIVKSIYLFGNLRYTTVPEEPQEPPLLRLGELSTLAIYLQRSTIYFLRILTTYSNSLLRILLKFINSLKTNQVLVFILIISGLFNFYLSSKTITSYWSVKKAGQMAKEIINTEPRMFQRAVYSKDVQDMMEKRFSSSFFNSSDDSKCYDMFKDKSIVLNNGRAFYGKEYGDQATQNFAMDLKKTLHNIAVKRNDLLVKLRMLNHMEEELARGEWSNWLISELNRCDYIRSNLLSLNDSSTSQQALDAGYNTIMDYCNSCSFELNNLNLI